MVGPSRRVVTAGTQAVGARTAASAVNCSGTIRNHAHFPRCSRSTKPTLASWDRWWLMVGWLRLKSTGRSQAQTSPVGDAAIMDTNRNRTGSASALKSVASSAAVSSSIASSDNGEQQRTSSEVGFVTKTY